MNNLAVKPCDIIRNNFSPVFQGITNTIYIFLHLDLTPDRKVFRGQMGILANGVVSIPQNSPLLNLW
jgi:hypothetical protein